MDPYYAYFRNMKMIEKTLNHVRSPPCFSLVVEGRHDVMHLLIEKNGDLKYSRHSALIFTSRKQKFWVLSTLVPLIDVNGPSDSHPLSCPSPYIHELCFVC
jgi:hypothetical protein